MQPDRVPIARVGLRCAAAEGRDPMQQRAIVDHHRPDFLQMTPRQTHERAFDQSQPGRIDPLRDAHFLARGVAIPCRPVHLHAVCAHLAIDRSRDRNLLLQVPIIAELASGPVAVPVHARRLAASPVAARLERAHAGDPVLGGSGGSVDAPL